VREIDKVGAAAVRAVERKVIRKMRRLIEEGAINASLINDDGLDDQGSEVLLSEQKKRIARDLRKSKRHAPVYLEIYNRRVESAERVDAMRGQDRQPLNIGVVVQVALPEYPVLQLEPSKET
jgi:hypothetical protein